MGVIPYLQQAMSNWFAPQSLHPGGTFTEQERRRAVARIASLPFLPSAIESFQLLHAVQLNAADADLTAAQLRTLLFLDNVVINLCCNCLRETQNLRGSQLKVCSGCRLAQYCSTRCKNNHREQHRPFCTTLNEARPPGWPLCKRAIDYSRHLNCIAAEMETAAAAERLAQGMDKLG